MGKSTVTRAYIQVCTSCLQVEPNMVGGVKAREQRTQPARLLLNRQPAALVVSSGILDASVDLVEVHCEEPVKPQS